MEKGTRNILLVEDEKITALFENRWLTDEGYNVIHTATGDEAVRIIKSGTVPVDMILMDIELGPGSIDGIKAAGEILKYRDIPLLFISSHTESEIVERTEHLTSYGYITKGSGYAVMLASIKMAFQLHKVNRKLKQQQESLKDREFWLNESQRIARIGHYNVNIKTGVWTSSPMLDELLGLDDKYKKDVSSWINTVHPDDREEMWEYRKSVLKEKKQFNRAYRVLRPEDGRVLWLHEVGNLSFDMFGEPESMFGTIQDITERMNVESALKESLKEKEILLKEIHHRVKNNLQIISSLLSLQNDSISLENFRKSINDSKTRIRTMAMIHEKLYRTSNFTNLQFDEYVSDLISYLYHTYCAQDGRIEIKEDYKKVVLPLDTAIPMALIINELVSNVFKYAFPGNAAGLLFVSMKLDSEQLLLIVKDNGVGLPEGSDPENTATLGLVMVRNLVQQLKGTLEMISIKGLECIICVPVKDAPVQ